MTPVLLIVAANLTVLPAQEPGPGAGADRSGIEKPVPARGAPAPAGDAPAGVTVKWSWTQTVAGTASGPGDRGLRYGGYIDADIDIAGEVVGLGRGMSLNLYPQFIYGENVNTAVPGLLLPPNAGLAYPSNDGEDFDLSLNLTRAVGRGSVTFGKINMVHRGARTALIGGGGLEGFQHVALASPPSLISQPVLFGALGSIPFEGFTLGFGVWDPRSAINRTGFEDPFGTGVAANVSVAVPVSFGGQAGNQKITLFASTKEGFDLTDVPDLFLPPGSEAVLGQKGGAWHVQYAFHQYVWRDPDDPGLGWGVFGRAGLWDGNPSPFRWQAALGVTGSFAAGKGAAHRFGLGYFRTGVSEALRDGLFPAVDLGDESGLEGFYTVPLGERLRLTADLQWIDPANRAVDSTVLAGVRLHLPW